MEDAHTPPEGIGGDTTLEKGVQVPVCQMSLTEIARELETHPRSDGIKEGTAGKSGAYTQAISSTKKERELKLVLGLIPVAPKAQSAIESEAPPDRTSPCEPRWGNMSTTVPLEERQRRNQELLDAIERRRETGMEEGWVEAQPASFPDESTWPSGRGFPELDSPGDRLPPPSDYEVQEAAKKMAIYEAAMRDLGLEP